MDQDPWLCNLWVPVAREQKSAIDGPESEVRAGQKLVMLIPRSVELKLDYDRTVFGCVDHVCQ